MNVLNRMLKLKMPKNIVSSKIQNNQIRKSSTTVMSMPTRNYDSMNANIMNTTKTSTASASDNKIWAIGFISTAIAANVFVVAMEIKANQKGKSNIRGIIETNRCATSSSSSNSNNKTTTSSSSRSSNEINRHSTVLM